MTVTTIADLEALSLQCHSEQSKIYISEAILCYKSGAYRAAIVSTWIAVVFDLIDKIRELALGGDAPAKSLLEKFENYVNEINKGNSQGLSKALEFEREILTSCRDSLQFFDQQQFIDLSRLKEDRHRCAHPSFQSAGTPYTPPAEQARLHIRNAIFHVLSQPPIQGKAAVSYIKTVIASELFPKETDKAITQLKYVGLSKSTTSLVKNLIDQLLYGFLTAPDLVYHKKQTISALTAIHEIHPAIFEERTQKAATKIIMNSQPPEVAWAIYLIITIPIAWELLDVPGKQKVESYISASPFQDIESALGVFATKQDLIPAVQGRINTMNSTELARVIVDKNLHLIAKERALNILSTSRSWNDSNAFLVGLIFPIFNKLTEEDIVKIIEMPAQCGTDLRGSTAFLTFIEQVKISQKISEPTLITLLNTNGFGYLLPQT